MAQTSPPPSPFTTSSGVGIPVTQQQKQLWAEQEQSGFFDIEPYIYRPMSGEKFADTWYSKLGLDPWLHIPSIPAAYAQEWTEERAVYLWGVPNNFTKEKMREHLKPYGTIEKLPQLIDTTSRETFRWVIMSNKEEAIRVITLFQLVKIKNIHGQLVGLSAGAPRRGLIMDFHRNPGKYERGVKKEPIYGHPGELGPGIDPPGLSDNARAVNIEQTPGINTVPREDQAGRLISTRPLDIQQPPRVAPPPGLTQVRSSSGAQDTNFPRYPPGITPPPGMTNYRTPASVNAAQYLGFGDTPGLSVYDTPTPLGTSLHTSVYDTPSKVKEIFDPKGKGKAKETETEATDNAFYNQLGQASSVMNAGSYIIDAQGQCIYTNPDQNPYQYPTYGTPFDYAPPRPVDPLIALLRKSTASKSTANTEAGRSTVAGDISQAAVPTQRKASKSIVAVPNITPIKQTQRVSASSSAPASKRVSEETTPAIKETLPTILETAKTPEPQAEASTTAPAQTAASSWATVAGTRSPGSKVIDVQPAKSSAASRLKSVRIPIGSNPSKSEPVVDQMRVVFLLDIPGNITLEHISSAVQEGPIRSIHFGMDEEKKSRFCAVVFQHANDAAKFTNVLLKERADSKPSRFKFIVDVVRGEEPFPLDDVLRAMLPPTNATRRLTLVKASFFFIVGERMLRAKVEKLVGEGAIQLIWLYNGGNATVVFSDVGSAILVKSEFDKWSRNTGQPDGAEKAWKGLQTSYSKDPCVHPMELKTALRD